MVGAVPLPGTHALAATKGEDSLPFTEGDRVRVPSPDGYGWIEAIYVTPSEPGRRRAQYVWVRYAEGRHRGLHDKVRYGEVLQLHRA